ncbi:DMT family transporter [Pseudomonas benzenivorans]|uniref:DMT family transporter n=1 Tax=Pseudomonas benzenivorans TaxID=556533 RepID=A0ABZ0PZG1_9PSED|nr:DMT family transporter [Pseudomonas benzenivorans]WPC06244.1 DMT family transporter [Pseudomonas benzenivorans]
MFNAHLCMLVWAMLVALSFFAVDKLGSSLDALALVAVRLLLSGLLFLPLLWRRAGRIGKSAWGAHGVLGGLLAMHFASMFEALRYTGALDIAMLFVTIPLLTLGCERFLLGVRVLQRFWPNLVAACGALTLLSIDQAQFDAYAYCLYGVGCLALALYAPLTLRLKPWLGEQRSAASLACGNLLAGGVLLTLLSLPGGRWLSLRWMTLADLGWLAYLSIGATLVTFWLLHRAIHSLPPATVIAYSYMGSLFALLLQALWFQQSPPGTAYAGAVMILIGMTWLAYPVRKTPT